MLCNFIGKEYRQERSENLDEYLSTKGMYHLSL